MDKCKAMQIGRVNLKMLVNKDVFRIVADLNKKVSCFCGPLNYVC